MELHCPLKLMTFSSQKEVVCGVILGIWVREKARGVVTFPPPKIGKSATETGVP